MSSHVKIGGKQTAPSVGRTVSSEESFVEGTSTEIDYKLINESNMKVSLVIATALCFVSLLSDVKATGIGPRSPTEGINFIMKS